MKLRSTAHPRHGAPRPFRQPRLDSALQSLVSARPEYGSELTYGRVSTALNQRAGCHWAGVGRPDLDPKPKLARRHAPEYWWPTTTRKVCQGRRQDRPPRSLRRVPAAASLVRRDLAPDRSAQTNAAPAPGMSPESRSTSNSGARCVHDYEVATNPPNRGAQALRGFEADFQPERLACPTGAAHSRPSGPPSGEFRLDASADSDVFQRRPPASGQATRTPFRPRSAGFRCADAPILIGR
jgi:hypothetical protein